MKVTKIILACLLTATMLFAVGCGAASKDGSSAAADGASDSAGDTADSANREAVFGMYDKVSLDQTKEQVDAAVGVAPKENSMLDTAFDYYDENTGFGVNVIYNDKDEVIAKTVIYNSHKDIAPFCTKAVTEDQADSIKDGSTYEEVKGLLGGDGVEVCATELEFDDNKVTKMYRWANSEGTGIQVIFGTDGKSNDTTFFDKQPGT